MALNINGTTGISGVDGSASAPALQGSDSNTGVSFGTDTVNIVTGGSIRTTVDSSGKVGIGTTSPSSMLDVFRSTDNATTSIITNNGTTGGNCLKLTSGGTGAGTQIFTCFQNNQSSETEIFRIDGAGDVGIGTSQPNNADSADGGLQIQPNHSNGAPTIHFKRASNGNTSQAMGFVNGNTGVGSITYTNGGTAFNTSSDYRLKENVVSISDGITRVKTLKPYKFNFIGDSKIVDGFLAHEVTPVVPEAITGEKDATENILYIEGETIPSGKKAGDIKETKPIYQGIDQAKLVPVLTAALQEAIAKIETLETKVAALEAA